MANENSRVHCAASKNNAAINNACDRCAKAVKTDDDFIECMGFCEQLMHARCAGLNVPFIKNIKERNNLFWMCDECVKVMKLSRFRSTLHSFTGIVSSLMQSQQASIAELRDEISKNGRQITQLAEKVNAATPIRPISSLSVSRPTKRRRAESTTRSEIITGTRECENRELLIVQPPPEMFWIYLSRFHPSVSVSVVEQLTREGLQTEEPIKVVSLVKKGTDLSSMNFVSFKVGVHPSLKMVALSPQTWPKGVVFREFEDTQTKNVWLPPARTLNLVENPTPSSTLTASTSLTTQVQT